MVKKGYKKSKEHLENWRKSRMGHVVTKDTREKIREGLKKTHEKTPLSYKHLHERKGKTLEQIYGIKGAIEHRKKLHEGHLKNPRTGYHHEPESIEKNRLAHLGKNTNRKGKNFEQLYGIEGAKKLKEKLRLAHLGQVSNRKGKTNIEEFGEEKAKDINKRKSIAINNRLNKNPQTLFNSKIKHGFYESKNNGNVWYRSSYELACMKYFDNNNIKWIYEGKQNSFFIKSEQKWYLNDFYLPEQNKYIQVKGWIKPEDKFFAFQKEYSNLQIEMWNNKILKEKGIL